MSDAPNPIGRLIDGPFDGEFVQSRELRVERTDEWGTVHMYDWYRPARTWLYHGARAPDGYVPPVGWRDYDSILDPGDEV